MELLFHIIAGLSILTATSNLQYCIQTQILVTLPCSLLDNISNAYPHASFWHRVWKPHHFKNDGKTHHWIFWVWIATSRHLGFSSFQPWNPTENFTETAEKKIHFEKLKIPFAQIDLIPSTTLTLRRYKQQISPALIGGPINNNFPLYRQENRLFIRCTVPWATAMAVSDPPMASMGIFRLSAYYPSGG